jgi:hypothetical protein
MQLRQVLILVLAIVVRCYPSGTTVMFSNGLFNPRATSLIYTEQIAKLAKESRLDSSGQYQFILGYNTTQGQLNDVLEATRQVTAFHASRIITQMWRFFQGRDTTPTRVLADSTLQYRVRASMRGSLEQSDLDSIGVKFVTAINSGNRFLHVTHSQGGLFANATYDNIPSHLRPFYRALEIATPAADIPLGSRYVTFQEDKVISSIRPFVLSMSGNIQYAPDALPKLPPNWAGPPTSFDESYHPLWEYLGHSRARALIASDAKELVADMSYPAFQHGPNWQAPQTGGSFNGSGDQRYFYFGFSTRTGYPWINPLMGPRMEPDRVDVALWLDSDGLHLKSADLLPSIYGFDPVKSTIAATTKSAISNPTPKALNNALGLRSTRDVLVQYGTPYIVRTCDSTVTWLEVGLDPQWPYYSNGDPNYLIRYSFDTLESVSLGVYSPSSELLPIIP